MSLNETFNIDTNANGIFTKLSTNIDNTEKKMANLGRTGKRGLTDIEQGAQKATTKIATMEQRLQKASSIASRVGGIGGGAIGQIGGGIGAYGMAGGAVAAGIVVAAAAWKTFAEAAEKANQMARDATKDTYDYLDKQAKSREMKNKAYAEFAKEVNMPMRKIIAKGGASATDTIIPLMERGFFQENVLQAVQETAGQKLKNKANIEGAALFVEHNLGGNAGEMIKKALLRPSTRQKLEQAGSDEYKLMDILAGSGTSEQMKNLEDYVKKYDKNPYPTGGLTTSMKKEVQRSKFLSPLKVDQQNKKEKVREQLSFITGKQEEVEPEILRALSQIERDDLRFIMANKLGIRDRDVPDFNAVLANEPANWKKNISDRFADSPESARRKYEQGILGREIGARSLDGRFINPEFVEDETKLPGGFATNVYRPIPWFNSKIEEYSQYKGEQIERDLDSYQKRNPNSDNQALKVLKEINENSRVKRTEP